MKVGIAGCGFMGEVHTQSYKKLGYDLYAIGEMNSKKLEEFSQKFSPKKKYNDVFDMIEDEEIDIIDICLPTPLHKKTAIAALNNNKHVLIEKPIALTIEEAVEIKKAASKSKGKLMVAHVLRFWTGYSEIRNLFDTQKLTKVKEIYASRYNELPLWSKGIWIMDEEKSGGIIIDLMIHDIDFIMWNLGKVNKVWAKGIINDKGFHIQVMAILEFESGGTAYIEGGYLNPKGVGLNSQIRVYTEDSRVEMYSHEEFVRFNKENAVTEQIKLSTIDGYKEEISYFLECIKNNVEPSIITCEDAIDSLAVCLALRNSLKNNNWVSI